MNRLDEMLDAFLRKHPELDPDPDAEKDNRRQLVMGLEDLHKSVISDSNLENVLKEYHDVFIYRKQLPVVIWHVKDQIAWLEECSRRLGFQILTTNTNIGNILSLLQRIGAAVTLDTVYQVCETLGKSGLEHYSPPAPPAPPPAPETQPFDWTTTSSMKDIPLTDPEGNPPPNWYLQSLNREQTRSYVRRRQDADRPATSTALREGQLPLDADEAAMKSASSKQLADLIRRRQAARYSR
jgi:hypothetical protein